MRDRHGYSGTPLPKKLGISTGLTVVTIKAPPHYRSLLGELPPEVRFTTQLRTQAPFIHLFVKESKMLSRELKRCRSKVSDNGTIWVSWPKKSSGVETDVTEDTIRANALPLGLVDTKVCAVDETWSGLKLMVRREERAKK
jgi:hypothetical protein